MLATGNWPKSRKLPQSMQRLSVDSIANWHAEQEGELERERERLVYLYKMLWPTPLPSPLVQLTVIASRASRIQRRMSAFCCSAICHARTARSSPQFRPAHLALPDLHPQPRDVGHGTTLFIYGFSIMKSADQGTSEMSIKCNLGLQSDTGKRDTFTAKPKAAQR